MMRCTTPMPYGHPLRITRAGEGRPYFPRPVRFRAGALWPVAPVIIAAQRDTQHRTRTSQTPVWAEQPKVPAMRSIVGKAAQPGVEARIREHAGVIANGYFSIVGVDYNRIVAPPGLGERAGLPPAFELARRALGSFDPA